MKLKTGQKCAFGYGAFGKDIVYMLIASYLLYYYNVVLGMSSVFIGTVMMAARIFDAFNDQAMTVVVSIILVYTSINICGNLVLYFFRFDVGNEGAYSIFAAVAFAAQVLVMMVIPLLRKKFSKSCLFISGFIIQIVGFAVILIMAFAKLYTPQSWYILCMPGILIYLGYGMLNVIMTIFLSDSVDYGEVMNGTREESVIFSMQTFTVKLASGVAVFLAGLIVDWIHLDTSATVQTQDTLDALRMWMTIPSVILLIVGIFVFKRFYKLDDARMEEIKSKLN